MENILILYQHDYAKQEIINKLVNTQKYHVKIAQHETIITNDKFFIRMRKLPSDINKLRGYKAGHLYVEDYPNLNLTEEDKFCLYTIIAWNGNKEVLSFNVWNLGELIAKFK